MVDNLDKRFNFYIIASNKDSSKAVQNNIKINDWIKMVNASVYYSSSTIKSIYNILKILNSSNYDIVYINGVFDPIYNLLPLIYIKFFKDSQKVIIAPRGQLFSGALKIKKKIKILYLQLIKIFKLFNNITFQATSDYEKKIINYSFSKNDKIVIAKNLLTEIQNDLRLSSANKNKLLYLQRIDENKNLLFALKIISKINYSINFDIYGQIKDHKYWNKCQKVIHDLPSNINVSYKGAVNHCDIDKIINQYGLMFLPTKGENFGHIIYEAFANGLPVIISDKTPWLNLKKNKVGFDLSLNKPESFVDAIEEHMQISDKAYIQQRKNVLDYINNYYLQNNNINNTINLFYEVLNHSHKQ